MSMRETFSNQINLAVINEYDQGAVMLISTVLRHIYPVGCRRATETKLFRHLSDHVFGVRISEIQNLLLPYVFQNI